MMPPRSSTISTTATRSLVELNSVSVERANRCILDSVSLTINKGDFILLRGANGAGKTTLIRCILGTLKPSGGHIKTALNTGQSGYVPQLQRSALSMPLLVSDVVAIGRCTNKPFWQRLQPEDTDVIKMAMQTVGISHLASRPIRMLSGGELQKMQLARVLAQQPELLLLDEPTAHLDAPSRNEFVSLLSSICASRDMAVLMVTHDEHSDPTGCNRQLILKEGSLHDAGL